VPTERLRLFDGVIDLVARPHHETAGGEP
jgi:hypothetical protein